MVLKGLPESYSAFATVITQKDKEVTFMQFKQALRSFEETEKSRSKVEGSNVFKIKSNSHIQCFKCKNYGHKKNQCQFNEYKSEATSSQSKRWCNYCKSSTHDTTYCRRIGKAGNPSGGTSSKTVQECCHGNLAETDGATNSFAMTAADSPVQLGDKCNSSLLVIYLFIYIY